MFDWLFEGWLSIYAGLLMVATILIALWYRDRRRREWLFGLVGVLALIFSYFLIDRLVETRFEQVRRKLQEMATAVKKRDAEGIFKHISPQFRYGPFDKPTFRRAVEVILANGDVDDLVIYDEATIEAPGKVKFRAKPKGRLPGNAAYYLVEGEFVEESDRQWRLKSFDIFNPYSDSKSKLDVGPYLHRK